MMLELTKANGCNCQNMAGIIQQSQKIFGRMRTAWFGAGRRQSWRYEAFAMPCRRMLGIAAVR